MDHNLVRRYYFILSTGSFAYDTQTGDLSFSSFAGRKQHWQRGRILMLPSEGCNCMGRVGIQRTAYRIKNAPENIFSCVSRRQCWWLLLSFFPFHGFLCGLFLVKGFKESCQKMCAYCFSDTLPLHVILQHVITSHFCECLFYFSCLFLSSFLLSTTAVLSVQDGNQL